MAVIKQKTKSNNYHPKIYYLPATYTLYKVFNKPVALNHKEVVFIFKEVPLLVDYI